MRFQSINLGRLESLDRKFGTNWWGGEFKFSCSTRPNEKEDNQSIVSNIWKIYRKRIKFMTKQVAHPMVKLQRQVQSLVESKLLKPSDSIWKIALLYGEEWSYWKNELLEFGFSMQDPVQDLIAVDEWDEE